MCNITESSLDSVVTEFYITEPKLVLVWLVTQTSSDMDQLRHVWDMGDCCRNDTVKHYFETSGRTHDRACRLRVCVYNYRSVRLRVRKRKKKNVDNVIQL